MAYGEFAEGLIDSSTDVDVYTFEGDAGDLVVIQIQRTSGIFYPGLDLYAPNDSLVKQVGGAGSHQEINDYSLPYSGTYTVHARDYVSLNTGSYWLSLQCRQDIKASAGAIVYDSFTDSLSVDPYGMMDGYVFEGSAGDLVTVQMHRTSGTFYPKLELFAPNDSLVAEIWGAGSHQKIVDCALPYSGTYTVFASDNTQDETGDYWLTLQCRQQVKANADAIAYDSFTDSMSVTPYGDMDAYTFDGSAGDLVIIQVHRTSGTFYPKLELFAPNDSLVKQVWGVGSHQGIVDYALPYSGTYTVFASDYDGSRLGDYWLTLQCRQQVKANAASVAYDSFTDSMSVSPYGDIDGYVFEGNAGDSVIIQIHRFSGVFYPRLELFAPNDSLVKAISGIGSHQKIVDYSLPYSGTYTVFARDNDGSKTGDYWLTLQCRQQVKANAAAIAYDGLKDSVSISPYGDMDAYTFDGSAGDLVIIRVHRTSGVFYPRLELFAPNDSLAQVTDGGTTGEIVDYALPYSGAYTVFASDSAGDKTGGYLLTLQCRQQVKANADAIAYDSFTDSMSVSPYGDMDAYTFDGSAGDVVIVQMHKTLGAFYPRLELFAPNDSLVTEIWGTGSHQKIADYTLPQSGIYTVFASDSPGNKTGDYWLTLQCRQEIKSHADTLPGKSGSVVRELDPYGRFEAFYISINKDDTTTIEMLQHSGGINPCIELYGPTDTLIILSHGLLSTLIADEYFVESGVYTIFLSDYEGDGIGTYELSWNGFVEDIIGVELPPQAIPASYRAYQSYPNPFNPICTIRFELPAASKVELKVFDVSGKPVRTIVDGWREPGVYREVWDGKRNDGLELPSGVYFYTLKAGKFEAVYKMVLLK
jgi:hypothetical protein